MAIELRKAPHYRELQEMRLAEVQMMTVEAWQAIRTGLREANALPKLKTHFAKHGIGFVELGVENPQQMEALFLQHIRRSDLMVLTYVSTEKGKQYRLWALIGMDNGAVALYNENRQQHWSFMRPGKFQGYLQGGRGWWVEVDNLDGEPKVRRW